MPANPGSTPPRVALLTQHGKERVLAPVLEPGWGCAIELVTGFDTDQLGTFTGETPRPGSQLDAARRKARQGMELSGLPIGLASEGSFGPDPFTGFFPWNVELLVWIDDTLGIEVVGIAQGADNGGHLQTGQWSEVEAFAQRQGFPAQQLVLRPEGPEHPGMAKGIADWDTLRERFDQCLAQAANHQVFVEPDRRAFASPARMARIEEAARDLLQRLRSPCPACEAPGYWVSERLPGLPCAACGAPTAKHRAEVWACGRCGHRHTVERHDRQTAAPAECGRCNP